MRFSFRRQQINSLDLKPLSLIWTTVYLTLDAEQNIKIQEGNKELYLLSGSYHSNYDSQLIYASKRKKTQEKFDMMRKNVELKSHKYEIRSQNDDF